ncbi:dethiobiotin synthase [Luteimonas sp. 22616]|uniref:dethiobiotin synthase n=1 Tax=Luteimonas sp. 22616 TaxID=3453951 RepID=UPI003F8540E9
MNAPGVFITGTDTGAGKTTASAALLHALRAQGLRAVGMKPLASGCTRDDAGRWRNDDALALQAASDPRPAYDDVNPFALPLPLAPEFAARDAGVEVDMAPILAANARLAAQADFVLVEGVGGWLAPLTATIDQVDLVRALDLPVVLVVGMRLGCLNHARLSARAIVGDGVRLAGWIASEVDPDMACRDDNFDALCRRLPAPCLGRLRWNPASDPAALAGELCTAELMAG